MITADSERWALTSARAATGFAVSVIMSPAEAGIERTVNPRETPDSRPGVIIQIYHNTGHGLKDQLLRRIGQCVLTCPTTAAFDAMGDKAVKRLKIGAALRYFGDGYQKKGKVGDRDIWRIPVMEGEFKIENRFGVKLGVAGGNFLILAENQKAGLEASERAVAATVGKVEGVIMSFPGGICRSGSKIGSLKYKLTASTNLAYCPTIRESFPDSTIPDDVGSVYELIYNGLNFTCVKEAMRKGIETTMETSGVMKISAANFGGKLGAHKLYLKKLGLKL